MTYGSMPQLISLKKAVHKSPSQYVSCASPIRSIAFRPPKSPHPLIPVNLTRYFSQPPLLTTMLSFHPVRVKTGRLGRSMAIRCLSSLAVVVLPDASVPRICMRPYSSVWPIISSTSSVRGQNFAVYSLNKHDNLRYQREEGPY